MSKIITLCLLTVFSASTWAAETRMLSKHDVKATAERAVAVLQRAQLPEVAERETPNGMEIEFTNPLYGSAIGACAKGLRKDKPLQMRIYEDMNGNVWLAYEEPRTIVNDFGVIECGNETAHIKQTLQGFASAVIGDE